jgi:hypothetical protein
MRSASVLAPTLPLCVLARIPSGAHFAMDRNHDDVTCSGIPGLRRSRRIFGSIHLASIVWALTMALGPMAAASDAPPIAVPTIAAPQHQPVPASQSVPVSNSSAPDANLNTNTRMVEWIVTSAQKHGLKLRQWGHGRVRFITVDDPAVDLTEALTLANQCMIKMEKITGDQDTFISKAPTAEQIFYLVLYNTRDEVITLSDELQAQHAFVPLGGENLVPKYPTYPLPHGGVGSLEQIGGTLPEWAVSMTAEAMMESFFTARSNGKLAPSWLREGLAADMQQVICERIVWTLVAIQDKPAIISNDWYVDVHKIMASHSSSKMTADELLSMNVGELFRGPYQQLWSLATYMRLLAKEQIGPLNKLRQIMDLVADGTSSPHAVDTVLRCDDGQLTSAWREWALEQ